MTEFVPNLPLYCIDSSQPEALGQPCEGCPMREQAVGCIALKAGVELAEKNDEVKQAEDEKLRLLERLFNLQTDTLIEDAFSPAGFQDHLRNTPELQEKMRSLNWGVIRLDGRFISYINKLGSNIGDEFLRQGGNEITAVSGLVRLGKDRRHAKTDLPVQHERRLRRERRDNASGGDNAIRQGGDEISLQIWDVSRPNLGRVAKRIQEQFTVPYAVQRYENGTIPFVASVGYSHARDNTKAVQEALADDNPWEAFYVVNGEADKEQVREKKKQYHQMWEMVVGSMPPGQHPTDITLPPDRVIAEQFLRVFCPDFHTDPVAFLERGKTPPRQ